MNTDRLFAKLYKAIINKECYSEKDNCEYMEFCSQLIDEYNITFCDVMSDMYYYIKSEGGDTVGDL